LKSISIGIANFPGGDGWAVENFFSLFPCLRNFYNFTISENPQVMFYGVYGNIANVAPNSIRVMIAMEGTFNHFSYGGKFEDGPRADFFHFGLTPSLEETRAGHFYLAVPYLNLNQYFGGPSALVRHNSDLPRKKYFCDFIYSNPYSLDRRSFCQQLQHYKRVECFGTVDCNRPGDVQFFGYNKYTFDAKLKHQRRSKFSIAGENVYSPHGYVSEKLSDPLVARSVPLYLGNSFASQLFNPEAFIHVNNYESFDAAIEYIKRVDSSPELYKYHITQPAFTDNKISKYLSDEYYLNCFRKIFAEV
jgi:hypothetical protein